MKKGETIMVKVAHKGETEMLTKVTDDISSLAIELKYEKGYVNCYLFKGKNGYTVLDTGVNTKDGKDQWEQILATGIVIEKIVLTHVHQDHIGLAKWFREKIGVPIIVSDIGYTEMQKYTVSNFLERFADLIGKYGAPNNFVQMIHDPSIYEFIPDGFFSDGDTMLLGDEEYKAILTPGHAPDQFCFYNRDRKIMMTGDHIIQEFPPVIGLWTGEEANPLADYFLALDKIQNYDVELALSSHGSLIPDFRGRVQEIKVRHEMRLEEVMEALKKGTQTAYDICQHIYGPQNNVYISSLMAIMTRVIYLQSVGKVVSEDREGVLYFTINN